VKILFISSNLIGDSILSTGLLSYLYKKNNDINITLVTGPTAKQLFDNFPNIEKIIVVKKRKFNFHWLVLWFQLIGHKWDLIVDLRSSFLSYILFTKKRKIYLKNNKPISQVEKFSNFMNSDNILIPKIYISRPELDKAKLIIKDRVTIAISPGGNWLPKIWPAENYNKLIFELQKKYSNKNLFFLIVGSTEEEKKYFDQVVNNVPKEYIINIMGKSLTLTYACLSLCKLFIGNDSGLMHLSAASGINTIGLFGPTRDDLYGPYGKNCYVIRTKENFKDLRNSIKNFKKSSMTSILIDDLTKFIERKNII